MEKFYIVTPSSPIHREYLDYKAMSKKVNVAFVEFAKEQGFETHEYYQSAQFLHICPTDGDTDKFGRYFKKNAPGLFKKNSQLAKAWVNKCQALGLKSPHKPNLGIEFRVFGRTSSRLFMINDVLYASFRADCDFKDLAGLKELKASEFLKSLRSMRNLWKSKLIFPGAPGERSRIMTREEIEGMRSNAIASCTTIDTMRDFVVRACDALLEDRISPAFFKVEDWLYGNCKDKPIEIQAAMLWGALMVVRNHGDIDWDRMRELFGEFMSKKMDLR